MQRQQVESVLVLAGIKFDKIIEIDNQYLPDTPTYAAYRRESPWWRVYTDHGEMKIGHRKRVYEFNWLDSNKRGIVTEDDVTKSDHHVHAYSLVDAVKYMSKWKDLPTVLAMDMYAQHYYMSGKKEVLDGLRTIQFDRDPTLETLEEVAAVTEYVKNLSDDVRVDLTYSKTIEHCIYRIRCGKVSIKIHS